MVNATYCCIFGLSVNLLHSIIGAKEVVDAACRCMFGLASSEMTLLYFLMYINSAGGLDVFNKPAEYAGRERRVKVSKNSPAPLNFPPVFSFYQKPHPMTDVWVVQVRGH